MFGIVKKRIMYIDVRIPFDEESRLARAYSRALADGISDWVLFLDHDVFLCNPHWYKMCLEAIKTAEADPKAACIGCECGGEYHMSTVKEHGEPNGNINYHIRISKDKYFEYGNMLQRRHTHVTGFFMLLKREVAKEIGFKQVKKTINNIDQDFGTRLMAAGYHLYTMKGLYVYHRRGMKHLKKEFKIQGDD